MDRDATSPAALAPGQRPPCHAACALLLASMCGPSAMLRRRLLAGQKIQLARGQKSPRACAQRNLDAA